MLRYIFRLRDVRRGKGDCGKIRQRNGPFFLFITDKSIRGFISKKLIVSEDYHFESIIYGF